MAPGVCVASFRVFLRSSDLLRFRLTSTSAASNVSRSFLNAETRSSYRGRSIYSSTQSSSNVPPSQPSSSSHSMASSTQEKEISGEVTVKYIQGLPHITVPLPSREEKCRFALKPVTHRVQNLIEMLKLEDRGIDRATVINMDGIRIASSCSIESLMDEAFWLEINDKRYKVEPPKRDRFASEDIEKLGDIRALVGQLYEAMNVSEYHLRKEEELQSKLEELKYELIPFEEKKAELDAEAGRKDNILQWAALGYMALQFGVLARLTWWEYSWDIMEPVTYFVTYGTGMCAYAYYCTTKTEYTIHDVKNRQYLLEVHDRAKKKNFDIATYNEMKRRVYDLEYDLRRLRDPLNLQLAPHLGKGAARRGGSMDPTGMLSSSILPPSSGNVFFTSSSKSRSPLEVLKELIMLFSRKKDAKQ